MLSGGIFHAQDVAPVFPFVYFEGGGFDLRKFHAPDDGIDGPGKGEDKAFPADAGCGLVLSC